MSERERNRKLLAEERVLVPLDNTGKYRVITAYPNRYWLAMSNLGFQTVYRLFAEEQEFSVERAYLPEEDFSRLETFETHQSVRDADILALSVSFETDYPYVLWMLEKSGLKLEREDDNDWTERPLIIGGGAALTLNPEPLADFFDAIVIGEGEETIRRICEAYRQARKSESTFLELLSNLSKIPGVYVPRFYRPTYAANGNLETVEVLNGAPERVLRHYVEEIDDSRAFTVIQTPNTEFKSMFMTETGRGCEVGCKFCVAGYMYRPTRKRSEENLKTTLKIGLEKSQSIGFVGAAVSSHPKIASLASSVAQQGKRAALSSIMSQRVSKELAASLSESEYKTVALAPEAGSEELRFRIGKRVVNEQIISAVEQLAEHGIRNFKLYFIVGLPSETDSDVAAIVELVRTVRDAALAAARRAPDFRIAPQIQLSVNPFIPKAWTPFQRHPMLEFKEIKRRIEIVRKGISRIPNVEMKYESPRESYFQALMSRGDRRVGKLLVWMHKQGLDWKSLVKTGKQSLLDGVPPADFYVRREYPKEGRLPWEIVDLRIKRDLLDRLYEETFMNDVQPLIARRKQEQLAEQR